jgi:hypothetical protein
MFIHPDMQRPTVVVGMWLLWWGLGLGASLLKCEVIFRFGFRAVLGRGEIGSKDPDAMSNERLVRLRSGRRGDDLLAKVGLSVPLFSGAGGLAEAGSKDPTSMTSPLSFVYSNEIVALSIVICGAGSVEFLYRGSFHDAVQIFISRYREYESPTTSVHSLLTLFSPNTHSSLGLPLHAIPLFQVNQFTLFTTSLYQRPDECLSHLRASQAILHPLLDGSRP